ncbi:protein shortage in chiasmata 1 ortholog isoform X2 [Phyllopteryx taeniolatus]|uniref:protein shortage in chiasmata 1 ortholog isoform X2 n=1 Tax=Phyllopteryx taeniolatus TaxID=161469 RepID=UPI002AD57128|nr:protein shortage in chiasmata 1 ortholog isoform X2 [Phyllopteryx taeniolatus]
MFSFISFKAIDYVFETRNRQKVMMDLLALPTPYIGDKDDYFPHSGTLAEVTYRKPWVRGKVLSTSLSASVLDDLRGTTQHINSTEKFVDPGSIKDKMEIVGSCPADSAELLHQIEETKLAHPCEESFFKLTAQLDPSTKDKDLLLLEDIMAADFLPRFKQHLPSLKSKVSRLKTLVVADPLISLSGDFVTEETIFRDCASSERPNDELHKADIAEEFTEEPLMANESLLLAELLDDCKMTVDYPSSFSSLCRCLNVVAEQLDEQLPDLEALNKDVSASVDIFHFSSVLTTSKGNWMKDTHPSDWATLPTDMELEVTLTPPTTATSHYHVCQSICDLQREELSLLGTLSLVSAGAQKPMEVLLWKAEKYPNYVLSFMFAEPEVEEAAVDFQPLNEALKLTTLESLVPETETGQFFGNMWESPERLSAEAPSHEDDRMVEEFKNVSPEPDGEYCLQSASPHPNESTIAADMVQKHTGAEFSQKTLPLDTKEVEPSTSTNDRTANKMFSQVSSITSTHKMDANLRSQKIDDQRGVVMAARGHLVQHADPLTSFIMLRSQQASPPAEAPEEEQEKQRAPEVHPTPKQTRKADRKPTTTTITTATIPITTAAVSGQAFRGQSTTTPAQDPLSSRVVQVQAIDSQRQAYRELLSLAWPRLSSAKELGLNLPAWRDFERLTLDQTRYVLKQREMALCRRTLAERGDEEQLFHQVLVIHTLVTARELLFKCHLSSAVEYLSKASETCIDTGLTQLLRRLHIILHLGRRNRESDVKLLELQKLVVGRLHNDKILVITSLNCDNNMSTIMQSLKQLTAVSVVRPDDDKSKLNGASVVSSIQDSGCVLVYEQHLGPDFPWDLFSLVVEYDHPGPSPWATVCKERRVQHLTFDTVLPGGAEVAREDTLVDKVAYVLLVTESLLNCVLLLQALESMFNITLLARSHCPTLQRLGGTNNYSVITVDESTVIVVQEQDELCEMQACEVIVMRLTALSLQYNYCWIILHCPDGKGGGFSSEAFSNLVVVYSSLVLFGMTLEDLDVKVLIASEVLEVARWVSRICFLNLMSSDRNPVSYLERDWLAVTSSQEEQHLSNFPCVNPLVAQLMLRRAPSLPWLLTASLKQLEEMLPEVPRKLFSDATSLYEAQPAQSVPALSVLDQLGPVQVGPVYPLLSPPPPPPLPPPPELTIPSSEPFPSFNPSFLLAPGSENISFHSQEDAADFAYYSAWPTKSPDLSSWGGSNLWKDGKGQEMMLTGCRGRAGAAGRVVERGSGEWSRQGLGSLDSTFGRLSPPSQGPLWRGGSHLRGRLSANYGSRYWMGQERKRSEKVAGLTGTALIPPKKSRLSYEKVPGRTDGQTRLKLF